MRKEEIELAGDDLIDKETAIWIAFSWHGGDGSGLYQWASTKGEHGADRAYDEALDVLAHCNPTPDDVRQLEALRDYLNGQDE